jgi:hypothetical protein
MAYKIDTFLIDNVSVTKSVTKSFNSSIDRKFKNPCKSLIYRGLDFEDVVPPGIEPIAFGHMYFK